MIIPLSLLHLPLILIVLFCPFYSDTYNGNSKKEGLLYFINIFNYVSSNISQQYIKAISHPKEDNTIYFRQFYEEIV